MRMTWRAIKNSIQRKSKTLWRKFSTAVNCSWTMRAAVILTMLQLFDAAWPVIPDEFKVSHWGLILTVLFAFLRMRSL